MEALDGNAIGGLLQDVFGVEMTMATGVCANCGATAEVATLVVYLEAPGTVARCRTCGEVVMVVVDRRGIHCLDLRGFEALEQPA